VLRRADDTGLLFLRLDRPEPELEQLQDQEQSLRNEFRTKHAKATNLEVYKQQLGDIEKSFGAMLRQLPSKTEVDNLLVDISQTGLAAALDQKLFQPEGEVKQGFLRRAADQDPARRQLSPVWRVRQRHRGAAAYRHAA
jgi:Tfp pilus assembly protein PilO